VIIDHTNGRVVEVLKNREKQTVLAYLKSAKASGLFAQVEEVTTDMWAAYVEAAREAFGPGVRITVDRFHVMKGFQEQLDAARRQLQRSLPAEAAKALKGMRWLLLKNWEHLTPDEREELAEVKRLFPELGRLHDLREAFRQVFENRARTPKAGRHRLRMWIAEARKLGMKSLDRFCKTLEHWMESIVNYFVNRESNGQTEGFNHKLRGILWRAFGMPNFQHFRFRILDACGNPRTLKTT
jgi:transposase